MNQVQSVTFTWRQMAPRAQSATRAASPWAVTGVLVAFALVAFGRPGGALFALALAASRLTFLIPPEARGDIVGETVVFHRQRWCRNSVVWTAVAVAVMGVAIAIQFATGEIDTPLVLVAGAGLLVAAVALFVFAVRFGGPIEVTAQGMTFRRGQAFRFDTHRFAVATAGGDPIVEVDAAADANGGEATVTVTRAASGLDANAVVSAVDQIRVWTSIGRQVSPWEIRAMMTATPPKDVPEGASVQLTVGVELGGSNR
ncbi:hypothetical protein [Williamsia phyllosphaerae]|uniref:hypothetical protein n=1 Tax=Williamsia phyllosphaerae TaxID=885042 RepID=UPI001663A272|nr:hypothetical protein [Williamsia phyllosphaerae]